MIDTDVQEAISKWFSEPHPTIEDAQNLHQPEPLDFSPAGVYKTQESQYVLGFLRVQNWSNDFVDEAARSIEKSTGLVMVSFCDPLFGVWRKVE